MCFLNTGDERFSDISSLAGIDFADDTRAIALSDWDQDGNVDFWTSNRNSPRLRMIHNTGNPSHHFLAIQLVGTRCNRDAIGASVEVQTDVHDAKPLVRYVHAGSGYLSQSSKWLCFGLGTAQRPQKVVIRWPDGETQLLSSLGVDRHYRVVQGEDTPRVWKRDSKTLVIRPEPTDVANDGPLRLIPHAPLPMPSIPYVNTDGATRDLLSSTGRATLVVLWATWCQPCLRELSQLQDAESLLDKLGLDVIILNVDDLDAAFDQRYDKAREVLEKLKIQLTAGLATETSLGRLDVVQQCLVSRHEALAIPASFLIDRSQRLAAIYRGPIDSEQLVRDAKRIGATRTLNQRRNEPLPMSGRWFVNPLPVDILAIPRQLVRRSEPEAALDYLRRWLPADSASKSVEGHATPSSIAQLYADVGIDVAKQGRFSIAIDALETAIGLDPRQIRSRAALASIYSQQRETASALAEYESILRLAPDDLVAMNNVAWILATSPDASLRDPEEAVRLATRMVKGTDRKVVSALDTLAAALAANGEWERAIDVAEEALVIARRNMSFGDVSKLETRLKLYQEGRPFLDARLSR